MKVTNTILQKWLQHLSNLLPSSSATSAKKQQPTETVKTEDISTQNTTAITSTDSTATLGPPTDSCAVLVDAEDDPRRVRVEDLNGGDRQTWDSPIEFLLSCISMSVGLGNVWRFPFTAYANGGGAFLIPYLFVLLFIGRPMYLLELSIGQFSSSGCVKMWDLAPGFRGIGYGQCLATFIVCSYYCLLIGTACYYLFASMQSVLPWTVCHPDLAELGTVCLPSSHNRSELNLSPDDNVTLVASAEQYFQRGVLKGKTDISDGIGMPDGALIGCLLLCWVMIYLILRKGVSIAGKAAYFTAIFPYLVMLTLLVRGLTLPGALEGVTFFFVPQWEKLLEAKVWYAAVTQSFFSLGIGMGCVITFSSYNRFEHNIYKDATIIAVADTFTSILAGVITFSILGHLAHDLGKPIDHVIKSGTGLAFISYPEVVAKFDFAPQLFAVLFFLMLITLGLGTAVGMINTCITVLKDAVPGISKSTAAAVVCVAGMFSGIAFTTPGGQPLLEMVDYFGGSLLILLMATCEVIVLIWVYGREKLVKDLNFMLGCELGIYWRFCWFYLVPISLSSILAYTLITYKPVQYAGIDLPLGARITGWTLFMLGVLTILGFLVAEYVKHHSIHKQSVSSLDISVKDWRQWKDKVLANVFRPLESYGPTSHPHRSMWIQMNDVKEVDNKVVGDAVNLAYNKEMDIMQADLEESPKLQMKNLAK